MIFTGPLKNIIKKFDKNQKPVGLLNFQVSLARPQNLLASVFGPVGFLASSRVKVL
jgi:hypothetical protein